MGKRELYLSQARSSLEKQGIVILRSSSVYESEPVDHADQPWFLNQVLEVRTHLSPFHLLKSVKTIERQLGRRDSFPKGPRSIDIDILLNENRVLQSPNLIIPHPGLHKRKFVLTALREISPDIFHPVLKIPVDVLWKTVEDSHVVRIYSPRNSS
jgi:2-amino-4-hydroxy-6-hydroxymethyldihydropteridine diphosphokinase